MTPDDAPRWLGPLRLPRAIAQPLRAAVLDLAGRLGPWPLWLVLAGLAGTLPVLLDLGLALATHRVVIPLLLVPLLLAAAAHDRAGLGLAVLGTAFLAHNALMIALAWHDPAPLRTLCPSGLDYWEKTLVWIRTGHAPEYELQGWLGAHLQLFAVVVLLTYTSFGLIPLWQGLHEVDLMNVYVGRLLAHSDSPLVTLALGWHPWSVCRGLGYLLLTYEIARWSLARATGLGTTTTRAVALRWSLGVGFLVLDALLKGTIQEPVRLTLAATLR